MASAPTIDFPPLARPVALKLLGEPNRTLSTAAELRYGAKGSLSIKLADATFYDHEAEHGGGLLDLITRERGGSKAEAMAWLESEGMIAPRLAPTQPVATFYDYADADGAVAYRVERRGKDARPPFLQHGPDGRGGFHAM